MALPIAAPGRRHTYTRSAFRAFGRSEAGGISNISEVVGEKNIYINAVTTSWSDTKLSAVETLVVLKHGRKHSFRSGVGKLLTGGATMGSNI